MANSSPYPRTDDVIFIQTKWTRKFYDFNPEPGDYATGHVMMASFQGDRPLHLTGFGANEAEAVADLYRELRDYSKEK